MLISEFVGREINQKAIDIDRALELSLILERDYVGALFAGHKWEQWQNYLETDLPKPNPTGIFVIKKGENQFTNEQFLIGCDTPELLEDRLLQAYGFKATIESNLDALSDIKDIHQENLLLGAFTRQPTLEKMYYMQRAVCTVASQVNNIKQSGDDTDVYTAGFRNAYIVSTANTIAAVQAIHQDQDEFLANTSPVTEVKARQIEDLYIETYIDIFKEWPIDLVSKECTFISKYLTHQMGLFGLNHIASKPKPEQNKFMSILPFLQNFANQKRWHEVSVTGQEQQFWQPALARYMHGIEFKPMPQM